MCRKEGNPFNTTVIPSAPTAAPPLAAAPYSAKAPGLPTNGPSITDIVSPTGDGKFFTAKRVTWISVLGALILVACMLCLCMLRCLKGRQGKKKNSERHDLGAYKASREKPKYGPSVQQNDQMEKGSYCPFSIFELVKISISYSLFFLKFGLLDIFNSSKRDSCSATR